MSTASRSQEKPSRARGNCHDRILITCARKFVTDRALCVYGFFFSASFASCVRGRSLFLRRIMSCARDRSPHFHAYAQIATKPDPDLPDPVQRTATRPAQIPEGPEALCRCGVLKYKGQGATSERSLKTGTGDYVKNRHGDFIKGRPAAYVKNTGGNFAKGPASHLSNYSK